MTVGEPSEITTVESVNGGAAFTLVGTPAAAITALWVTDTNNIFVGTTGGVNKLGSFTMSAGLTAAVNVVSFAMSPKDASKATFMVGLANGTVFESTNNCTSFTQVGTAAVVAAVGPYVAYGPDGTRYAAAAQILSRYDATGWTTIGTLTAPAAFVGLAVSTDGTVYTANNAGSIGRILNPTAAAPEIGNTAPGTAVSDLAVLSGTANSLYVIDATAAATTGYIYAGRIKGFSDTLIGAATINAPKNKTVVSGTTTTTLTWPAIAGATNYRVTVDGVESADLGNVTSSNLAGLTAGSSHTWSVRASAPIFSRSSDTATFIMSLDAPPVQTEQLPKNGAVDVVVDTTFSWPAVAGGVTYEFAIAEELGNADKFAIIDYSATTTTNAHKLQEVLKYNTQYWWRVRAVTATSKSAWTTSMFTTEKEPVVTTTTEPITTIVIPTVTVTPTTIVVTNDVTETTPIPAYLSGP